MSLAYFDRTLEMYITATPTFDGTPVDVASKMTTFLTGMRVLFVALQDDADFGGAPEDIGQKLADRLAKSVQNLIEEYTQ